MNIQNVTKLFDLEYFDGPLLSLFADSNGNFFLYKWYDLVNDAHQWLVFKVKFSNLRNYLNGKSTEYELLKDQEAKTFYLIEFSEKGKPQILKSIPRQDILREYDDLKSVFFKAELCPNWKAVQQFFHKEKGVNSHFSVLGSTPDIPTNPGLKFRISPENDNLYYFYLLDKNDKILMKSEPFPNVSAAKKGAQNVRILLTQKRELKNPVKKHKKLETQP
jgi:uncharacterized protein YegP (UPF0339 family)